MQMIQTAFQLYCRYGTLKAAAQRMGVTNEWVRQLLQKGNDWKLCAYNPKYRVCDKLPFILEAFKTATSWNEVWRHGGYRRGNPALYRMLQDMGIPKDQRARFKANHRRRMLSQLEGYIQAISSHSTTALQKIPAAKSLLQNIKRVHGMDIIAIREALHLPAVRLKVTGFGKERQPSPLGTVLASFCACFFLLTT